MRRVLLVVTTLALGCSSKDPSATPAAGSGYQATGKKPANARRPTAPPEIEAKALAVGAMAPDVTLTDPAGAPWRLGDALAKHARVMLVFYRGDW